MIQRLMLCCGATLLAAQSGGETAPPALKGLDPVWLVRGEQRPGKPEHEMARAYYTYRFETAETRREFLRDPERFAIQLDGACARMGAASGAGSPDRWAVHAGRIYIFASDQCRASFLREPDSHIDPPEPPRAVNAERAAIAKGWLDRARGAHGIAAGVRSYRETSSRRVKDGVVTRTYGWSSANGITEEFDYPNYGVYGDTVTATGGTYFVKGKREPHRPAQHRARAQQLWRHPVVLLAGREHGVATAWPERENAPVREIGIDRFGAATRLGLDPDTGRVVHMRYRGRGPEMTLGEIVDRFSGYRTVNGVLVPFQRESTFNGKPWPERTRVLDSVEIDTGR